MSAMTALRSFLSVVLVTVVLGLGSPAFADSPQSWNAGPSRTALQNVVFFGGAVVGLFILITLFALLTARNNFVPEPPEPGSELDQHGHH